MVTDRELAELIVAAIFDAPYPKTADRVQRIAFRGGTYPGRETDLGGLGKPALTDLIEKALHEHRSF